MLWWGFSNTLSESDSKESINNSYFWQTVQGKKSHKATALVQRPMNASMKRGDSPWAGVLAVCHQTWSQCHWEPSYSVVFLNVLLPTTVWWIILRSREQRGQKESTDTVWLAADRYAIHFLRRFLYINSVNKQFASFSFFNNCSKLSDGVLKMLSLNMIFK